MFLSGGELLRQPDTVGTWPLGHPPCPHWLRPPGGVRVGWGPSAAPHHPARRTGGPGPETGLTGGPGIPLPSAGDACWQLGAWALGRLGAPVAPAVSPLGSQLTRGDRAVSSIWVTALFCSFLHHDRLSVQRALACADSGCLSEASGSVLLWFQVLWSIILPAVGSLQALVLAGGGSH